MAQRHDASFDRLIALLLTRLERIAAVTCGEQSVDDLRNEAWIIADGIRAERGVDIDPDDEEIHATIIAQLYKQFGQFVDRPMRFAVRLDKDERDDDGDFRKNAVSARLSGPRSCEPEVAMQLAEDSAEAARIIHARFAEATAYYYVFEQFDGDRAALARHLAIQPSTLKMRLGRADTAVRSQPSMFDGIASIAPDFWPLRGKWRHQHAPARFLRVCGQMRPIQRHLFLAYGAVFR